MNARGVKTSAEQRIEDVRELHAPHFIYDYCDHNHSAEDRDANPPVVYVDDIGYTCTLSYVVCRECCCDEDYHSERCVSGHTHRLGDPICATGAIIDHNATERTRQKNE